MQFCWRTNFMGQEEDISSLYVNLRRIEMIPTYASSSPLFCYDSLFLCLGRTRWRVRLGTQLRREGKWLSKCYLQRITLLNLFSAIPGFLWLEVSEFLRVFFLWGWEFMEARQHPVLVFTGRIKTFQIEYLNIGENNLDRLFQILTIHTGCTEVSQFFENINY